MYCNNCIYANFRTLSEQLETIDVKKVADEIYEKLCTTYQFPDIVSNIKIIHFLIINNFFTYRIKNNNIE